MSLSLRGGQNEWWGAIARKHPFGQINVPGSVERQIFKHRPGKGGNTPSGPVPPCPANLYDGILLAEGLMEDTTREVRS